MIDGAHISAIAPVIGKCIRRLKYIIQKAGNISICIKLLKFMIENSRILFTERSLVEVYTSIIQFINYSKMALRTTFIDLHNTEPPLWKAVKGSAYKDKSIEILKCCKKISMCINTLIDKSAISLDILMRFLRRDLVPDPNNTLGQQVKIFKDMILRSKLLEITIPSLSLGSNNEVIYNITKNFVINFSIPPKQSREYNIAYINKHIKNKPY